MSRILRRSMAGFSFIEAVEVLSFAVSCGEYAIAPSSIPFYFISRIYLSVEFVLFDSNVISKGISLRRV